MTETKPPKILYVEDDESLAFITKDNLEIKGYDVVHVSRGDKAIDCLTKYHYDICLLDVMLPHVDGFEVATQLRKINDQIPILFLTARSLKEDKIKGLTIGGDDYITKPFNIEELLLRIEIFLKRSNFVSEQSKEMSIGEFTLNVKELKLEHPSKTCVITKKECELLAFLIQNKEKVLSRSQILKSVWGEDDYFLGRSMDVFISRCRKYLKPDSKVVLETIYKVGFKLTIK